MQSITIQHKVAISRGFRLSISASVLVLVVAAVPVVLFPAREAIPSSFVDEDVVYAVHDDTTLLLDVYRPKTGQNHPALLAIHGGGWRYGSKERWSAIAPEFARAGFVVFAINYRLAPPGGSSRYPAAQDDATVALQWVRDHARRYGADPYSVSAIGSSAGGQIALMLAADRRSRLEAVAAWSPAVKLKGFTGHISRAIRSYLGCSFAACPSLYREASPIANARRSQPPTFIVNSKDEIIPLRPARRYRNQLVDLGVDARLRALSGTSHGLGAGIRALSDAISFLREHSR